jgi:hypothetical protein
LQTPRPESLSEVGEEGGCLESNEILLKISPSIALENGTHPRLFQANLHRPDAKKARSGELGAENRELRTENRELRTEN